MRDIIIVDKAIKQFKGQLHFHTSRSSDCKFAYHQVLEEYKSKGYDFCLMTDHEVYWDSDECDTPDFVVLSGVENAFLPNVAQVFSLDYKTKKQMHFNLIKDLTVECDTFFKHGDIMKRPVDYGIESWNDQIQFYKQHGQLTIFNHPSWSRVEPEMMLATQGCVAFEVWNTASIKSTRVSSDEAIWDYCLSRGKRIRAVATDDAHLYGVGNIECGGGFTVVSTYEFTKKGLVAAIKNGDFYASTGPRIIDLRIVGGILQMQCTPVNVVRITTSGICEKKFTAGQGRTIEHFEWEINTQLNYFRIELLDNEGNIAWSQAVFIDDWFLDRV